ncbi:MAG: Holliday junction resolvase RuvX [Planctomycetota bacterium]|nr:Holliday junction resolvase RuvX [Planctomycetota bacterium]
MRYVAIDLGDKRTGLAVGDAMTRLATPLEVLEVPIDRNGGDALLDAIERAVVAQLGRTSGAADGAGVAGGATPDAAAARGGFGGGSFTRGSAGELVVGLPMNMDGSEGQRAKLVRAFAARIGARTGRVIHFFDERLTSADADWAMARTGMTHKQKKERRDAIAAAVILRGFLDSLPRE